MSANSFGAKAELEVGGRSYDIFRIDALQSSFDVARLPFSLKILLENLLRNEDGEAIRAADIEALAKLERQGRAERRDRLHAGARGDAGLHRRARRSSTSPRCATRCRRWAAIPNKINPLVPAELVIDHSVQVDVFGTAQAFERNAELEFERNKERYSFLRWGQTAFDNFKVVPPDTGIVHQVNLEYLSRVVFVETESVGAGRRPPGRLPRHARRHRLAHDDGQRPRRARLGRRRHRGRGGDARPADVDADPAGDRLQARRRAARGRDRHRPRADRHRDAAQARRRRQVRRVLRRRAGEPAAGRPRDDRQHVARVRLDLRDLPDRCRDAALPRVQRPPATSRSSWSRPTPRPTACGTTRTRRSRPTPTCCSSTSRPSCRASPGRSGPRTACR